MKLHRREIWNEQIDRVTTHRPLIEIYKRGIKNLRTSIFFNEMINY